MKISKVEICNFKGYSGITKFNFNNNMVYISGENNVGKSSLFEAINLVVNGNNNDFLEKKNKCSDKPMFVNLEFSGKDIPKIIEKYAQGNKKNVFKKYIFEKDDTYKLVLSRASNNKNGDLCIYNEGNNKFENPSGISAPIKKLFKFIVIDADDSADNEVNFKKSGTIGKLLSVISDSFSKSEGYKKLEKIHKEVFDQFKDDFSSKIDKRISEILHEQYDENVETNIKFNMPDVDKLITNAKLLVDDGIETDIYDKGNGLQRSVALALIQLQAEFEENINSDEHKPVFYFIDEPEVFLHPRGQHKLRESLEKLSKKYQMFISTHSPFILDNYDKNRQDLCLLEKKNDNVSNKKINKLSNVFENPTCAEIIYYAFDLPTMDFHNQLYNIIQCNYNGVRATDNALNSYYEDHKDINSYSEKLKVESESQGNENYKMLSTKIRNIFHHFEISNNNVSVEDLDISIKFMIDYCNDNNITNSLI